MRFPAHTLLIPCSYFDMPDPAFLRCLQDIEIPIKTALLRGTQRLFSVKYLFGDGEGKRRNALAEWHVAWLAE